jgi:hypothetical protein
MFRPGGHLADLGLRVKLQYFFCESRRQFNAERRS